MPPVHLRVLPRYTTAIAWHRFLIDNRPHDLNPHPQRVELVAAAFAEVVIEIAAALVVEAEPEFFLVLGQLDFEWLAGRRAFEDRRTLGLEEDRERVVRLLAEREVLCCW